MKKIKKVFAVAENGINKDVRAINKKEFMPHRSQFELFFEMKKTDEQQSSNITKPRSQKRKLYFFGNETSEETLKLSLRRAVKNQSVPCDLEANVFYLIEKIK